MDGRRCLGVSNITDSLVGIGARRLDAGVSC